MYSEFENVMLVALYQEQMSFDRTDYIPFLEVIKKYGIEAKPGWAITVQKGLRQQGLIDGPSNGSEDDMAIGKISGRGLKKIEDQYGSKDGVGIILQPADQAAEIASVDHSETPDRPTASGYRIPEGNLVSLVRGLDRAESDLQSLDIGQEGQSQVRAYIVAAKALAEAPEPQADLIWELISRANSIAGVASLFVSILALFIH